MLPEILRQIQTPPPGGCKSARFRLLLEDFFSERSPANQRRSLVFLKDFAEYKGLPRDSWMAAVEQVLDLPAEAAANQYNKFRRWMQLIKVNKAGLKCNRGTGIGLLGTLARRRGLITWSFPSSSKCRTELCWQGCTPVFRAKVTEWADYLLCRNLSPATIASCGTCLRTLGEFLRKRSLEYHNLDHHLALEWIRHLFSLHRWSERTIEGKVTKAREFYRWLLRRKVLAVDPFEDIAPIKFSRKLPVFLTEPEMNLLIDAAETPFEKVVIEFLYATGCRVGELSSLDLADLSWDSRTIKCMGKSRRERLLLFNEATVSALREYLPYRVEVLKYMKRGEEPSLIVSKRGDRATVQILQRAVTRTARRVGFAKHVTAHSLRHSYGTHLLNHGADLHSLMTLMGHKTIEATLIYLHIATDRLAEVYRRCHPRK